LGQRQPVFLARIARARVQAAGLHQSSAAVLAAGAQIATILALNFRGRVPILKDGDYVVFESLAVLYYLDLKYPDPPIFGHSPEEPA